jgi:phosphate transport system substrate-binding protein
MKQITLSRSKAMRFTAALFAVALVASACGSDSSSEESSDTTAAGGSLSGSVRIDGSSTVGPLSEVAAELFMNEYPDVRVTVAISGTSGGFQKFCQGETDGNNASRAIKDTEIEECEKNNVAYEAVQVANDALSIVVNKDNPVTCMTVEQISAIWDQDATTAVWGDVEGLDIPADFASTRLALYGPGTDSGTFDYFTEEINGEEGRIRNDYTDIGEDDNAAVVAVEGNVGAMGFIPYSYYQEAQDQVKALSIDDGNGCVDATLENVQDGSYTPLGRPLFVYASDVALQRAEALAFMEFYVENSASISEVAGFVPMNPSQVAKSTADVANLVK